MISKAIKFALMLAIGLSLSATYASAQKGKAKSAPKKKSAVASKKPQTPDPTLPKVTQIDNIGLLNLLKRQGENPKPLLINFWATWCGPCVEEFPDLVKIDNDYKGKIDFITITIDDIEEINRAVPKFLGRMKAEMPTYLLKTDDEGAAISMVDKDLSGALPITILFDGTGKITYKRQAKIVVEKLRSEIDKVISTK